MQNVLDIDRPTAIGNTSTQHTLNTPPTQLTFSTYPHSYPVNKSSQYISSMHPLSTSSYSTHSNVPTNTRPFNAPFFHPLYHTLSLAHPLAHLLSTYPPSNTPTNAPCRHSRNLARGTRHQPTRIHHTPSQPPTHPLTSPLAHPLNTSPNTPTNTPCRHSRNMAGGTRHQSPRIDNACSLSLRETRVVAR